MTKEEQARQEQFRQIRGEMVKNGITNAQIARDAQVSTVYVYYVLTGRRAGYRIRRAIAKAVHQPVEKLWPDTPPAYRRAA
ncbi:MAG TPA: transcriptional regulator [Candidatus Omnitrophica bacterium]|nr:transcriptional regulator [Candidatus Omnitrophota bacterium]